MEGSNLPVLHTAIRSSIPWCSHHWFPNMSIWTYLHFSHFIHLKLKGFGLLRWITTKHYCQSKKISSQNQHQIQQTREITSNFFVTFQIPVKCKPIAFLKYKHNLSPDQPLLKGFCLNPFLWVKLTVLLYNIHIELFMTSNLQARNRDREVVTLSKLGSNTRWC